MSNSLEIESNLLIRLFRFNYKSLADCDTFKSFLKNTSIILELLFLFSIALTTDYVNANEQNVNIEQYKNVILFTVYTIIYCKLFQSV